MAVSLNCFSSMILFFGEAFPILNLGDIWFARVAIFVEDEFVGSIAGEDVSNETYRHHHDTPRHGPLGSNWFLNQTFQWLKGYELQPQRHWRLDSSDTSASSCCGVTQHLAIKVALSFPSPMKCLKGIRQIKGLMKEVPEDWRKCQLTCKVNESELGVRFVPIDQLV